jgi:hypothetical protein
MRIRTRYYFHNKGKYYLFGGYMVIKDRQITRLGDTDLTPGKSFYFDRTVHLITFEHNNRKGIVDANTIITESSYQAAQREFIVKLNWAQQQKISWMFKRHWLQRSTNIVHLAILFVLVTLAFMGIEFIHHKF